MLRWLQPVRMRLLLWATERLPAVLPLQWTAHMVCLQAFPAGASLRRRAEKLLQFQRVVRTLQVAEVRETQPDCRLYIAITKCDQLEETPSVAEEDTGEPDSSNSSNGGARSDSGSLAVLKHTAVPDMRNVSAPLSHGPA